MDIDYEIVGIPVLTLWHAKQRELAEIMITMLAGSLVEHGGYNPTQAGVSPGKAKSSYLSELERVFVKNNWLSYGQSKVKQALEGRSRILHVLRIFQRRKDSKEDVSIDQRLEHIEQQMGEMESQLAVIAINVSKFTRDMDRYLVDAREAKVEIEDRIDLWEGVRDWLLQKEHGDGKGSVSKGRKGDADIEGR
jgi:hypothetical protein